MRKEEREAFDRKVLHFVRAKGTVCVNQVARHFNKKWETALGSINRLQKKGLIFYHPEMGDNPSFYSIWKDVKGAGAISDTPVQQPAVEKQESELESNEVYARLDLDWTRAEVPSQIVEKGGFVCHPSVDKSKVPPTFVRAHMHGQYLVRILKVGVVPSTYRVPNTEIVGGWTSRLMGQAKNRCYYGHMKFPEDRDKYKFHSMADKEGHLSNLSVYVHPRFIYYKGNAGTASVEFSEQVKDVLRVLEQYGWEFGEVIPKGTYSMGYNNRAYAEQMPKNHVEKDTDVVKFDSSPGSSDKGCTEAEIYHDGELSERQMDVLVEHPQRIMDLEARADSQSERITVLDHKLDKLIDVAEKNVQLTELTMTVSMGGVPNAVAKGQEQEGHPVTAFREDVMYG